MKPPLRRALSALACAFLLAPCATAQLPPGEYLLTDPVNGIYGIALALPPDGDGIHTLYVTWIDALGDDHYVFVYWNPGIGCYSGLDPIEYRFGTWTQNGVAHYGLDKENLAGGWTNISKGTIQ